MPGSESHNIPDQLDTSFLGHPRGLSVLFFVEMWERFSYYGMRAILILFMTASVTQGGLGFDVSQAGVIYGLYTAIVYMAALPGGWLADHYLGLRRAVFVGGCLIAVGNAVLMIPGLTWFYAGLALIAAGTGLLKPNVSAIVGQLYSPQDKRRDAAFSVFYMGINLGAFLAPLLCGYVAQRINWRYGFGIAGLGMLAGLVQYIAGARHLGNAGFGHAHGAMTDSERQQRHRLLLLGILVLLVTFCSAIILSARSLITVHSVADVSGALLVALALAFFTWLFKNSSWTREERQRLTVVMGLFAASAIFWSVFEQAGSTLNLFAQEKTDNSFGGFDMPASWYQSINALFIISLAPVFAWLWIKLGSREPASPAKFVWGLILVGLGFLVLAGGAANAEIGVRVSPLWLLLTYLLHTMGELCLSPVGLSAMTKLAPTRVAGLMMGAWFLSLSIGNYIGGRLAGLYESLPLPTLFGSVGAFAICSGLLLAIFVRPMVRLMGGVR